MTDPTLTLTATVPALDPEPMQVECDTCKGKSDCPGYTLDGFNYKVCPDCDMGDRAVRYEVVAPLKTRPAFTDVLLGDFNQAVAFVVGNGDINAAMHDGWENSIALQIMGLHRSGEELPGVKVTEKPCESSE